MHDLVHYGVPKYEQFILTWYRCTMYQGYKIIMVSLEKLSSLLQLCTKVSTSFFSGHKTSEFIMIKCYQGKI